MNVFRRKKEAKESSESVGRGSSDIETSTPTLKSSKTFRLGKKTTEPEPKLELDLENALPSSDDFRTSLLMNGLSARFSMLREQDDPNSKIGKASDDSVLFPKRQSRLNDFGFQAHNLTDIAEVSSMHGSVRPPLSFSKTDLSVDGYGTDDDSIHAGSIMSRPRQGEGNVLFGGRQKIYKISAKSSSKGPGEGGGMGGRALYDNDVSQSAFQKLREKAREELKEHNDDDDDNVDTSADISRPGSPPLAGYNRNRETSSTTSSGPTNTRSSTAATSVTSQRTPSLSGSHTPISAGGSASGSIPERSATKTRRLYETGLDQHLHEQQHSTMNRIDTLTRQRNMGAQTPPLGMHSPTSATSSNAFDRWDRQPILGKGSMPNLRAASPPPPTSAISGFDFGVKSNNLTVETKFGYSVPPLSPPASENDENSAQPVHPNDKSVNEVPGVNGARPSQAQDENRQPEREAQVPHGRETPTFRKHPPPGVFVPRQQPGSGTRTDSSATADSSQTQSPGRRYFPPRDRLPDLPSSKPRMGIPESPRAGPGPLLPRAPNSNFPRSPSSPEHAKHAPTGGRPWGLPQPKSFPNLKYRNGPSSAQQSPETELSETPQQAPAPESPQQRSASPSSPPMILEIKTTPPNDDEVEPEPPADSPTLPGLSGMVRQHLRSDSNGSSIYNISSYDPHALSDPIEPSSPADYNAKGNPWDINDWDEDTQDNPKASFESTASSLVKVDSALPEPLIVKPNVADGLSQESSKAAWEVEMEKHHNRSGSSASQKEQEDFKNELASRRRQVQENLKHLNEPGSFKNDHESSRSNALGLLKAKTSFGSLAMKQKEAVGQSKAMKMMGMGSQPSQTNQHAPMQVKNSIDENSWKKEEEDTLRNVPGGSTPPQMKAFRQARRDAQRDRERELAMRHQKSGGEFNDLNRSASRRGDPRQGQDPRHVQGHANNGHPPNMDLRQRAQSRERKPPPMSHAPRNPNRESKGSEATSNSGSRPPSRTSPDRSGSDASGRSKSRNGRYRDDLAKAMAEGTGSSSQGVIEDLQSARLKLKPTGPGLSPGVSPGVSPGLSHGVHQASPLPSPSMGARSRSNSKANNAGYFDPQRMPALQTGDALDMGVSPRPSPVTPFSVNSTPSLVPHSPVDARSTTPTTQGFQTNNNRAMLAGRKKSVTKSEISEPMFISSTSRVSTIDLPPGSSLQNGIDAPPIPPVNPRRRQTRTMFGAFIGKKDECDEMHSLPGATQSTEEMSTFSADEESIPKSRQRLRKSSSEGGNLNAKARQVAYNAPSPAMPSFPAGVGYSSTAGEGGMF
ncbi:hypothetical protein ACMFMG_000921 [Clarireedia jacksonii]